MRSRALAERCYRLCLRLYPKEFRDLFGGELMELFRDRRRKLVREQDTRALLWLNLRTFLELLTSSLAERASSARRSWLPAPDHISSSRHQTSSKGTSMLSSTLQDLRYALKSVASRPTSAIAVLLTLAVGIGANSTFFSVVDTVLLRPLPFDEPDRLVTLYSRYGDTVTSLSPPDYVDRRDLSETLEASAAIQTPLSYNLGGLQTQAARKVTVSKVTSAFFEVLGVNPALGNPVFPHEASAEAANVAVISHELWVSEYDADPKLLGTELTLHGEKYTVLAVMESAFDFPRSTDIWLPLTFTADQLADSFRGNEYLRMVARAKEGVALETVQAEMETIAAGVIEQVPARAEYLSASGWGASTGSLEEELVGNVRTALLVLLATVALVLLIACFNVANILMARTAERSGELALRSSLGASRGRLLRQLFTENCALALLGCGLGLALAHFALAYGPVWIPHDVPRLDQVRLDLRVTLFTMLVGGFCAITFGMMPALKGSSAALRNVMQSANASRKQSQLRSLLVVGQVAVALILLVGAGLLGKSFDTLMSTEPGFDSDGRVTLRATLPDVDYADDDARRTFQRVLTESFSSIPQVESTAISGRVPLDGRQSTGTFHIVGNEDQEQGRPPSGETTIVGSGFFRTMGITVEEGREFDQRDATGPNTAIVDRWAADRYWPGESPVGRSIYFSSADRSYEVIAVVGHVKQLSLSEEGKPQVYLSAELFPPSDFAITVHSNETNTAALMVSIREQLRRLAPGVPPYRLRTLRSTLRDSVVMPRFHVAVMASFSTLALLLAAIGLYGLLSHSVSQRTAEIGTRMALGATRINIVQKVLREGLLLTIVGCALGVTGALILTRFLSGLLFQVSSNDPSTFVLVVVVLLTVATLAAFLPARRAATLDPMRAIRVR